MSAVRRSVAAAARRIDRAIGRAMGPRRVLVEVRTPMNLEVLRPIWGALAREPALSLTFVAEDEAAIRALLAAENADATVITTDAAAWTRFDLAFNADPWSPVELKRCWRRVNFFHGVAGKYDLDNPHAFARTLDLGIYDKVMFPNADRMRRYLEAGLVTPQQAALVGFPKTDDLINGRWRAEAVRAQLSLDPSRTTVLYAPTFSPAASLHLAGDAIIESLLSAGFNVIVKLHDRSLRPHPKFTGGVDWRRRLARFEGHPGYAFATSPHAGPYLTAADVLVTDHSTVGFEFALLDRPIVVFDAPGLLDAARIAPERWQQLRAMSDVVTTAEDLPAAVRRALGSPGRLSELRRATAQALFAHAGEATERALAIVYALL